MNRKLLRFELSSFAAPAFRPAASDAEIPGVAGAGVAALLLLDIAGVDRASRRSRRTFGKGVILAFLFIFDIYLLFVCGLVSRPSLLINRTAVNIFSSGKREYGDARLIMADDWITVTARRDSRHAADLNLGHGRGRGRGGGRSRGRGRGGGGRGKGGRRGRGGRRCNDARDASTKLDTNEGSMIDANHAPSLHPLRRFVAEDAGFHGW